MSHRSGADAKLTELALAAGRGESAALEEFIRTTQRDVIRVICHLSGPQDAEDLAQETFLRAIGALHRFEGRSSARTWLISIARRVVVDARRHARARPRLASQDVQAVFEATCVAPGMGLETRASVLDLLSGLSPERREALVLTQVLGFSYAEAADVTGVPIGTVRSRVSRARADLEAATPSNHVATG
ncbi:sigma-70 family RNA polymerase sigma factor [Gordonia sp. VNK1]|uniref:sigma-70 family RNA polymerase sigma factor n=1 Tax=Gordonia oleivorans TaxID=3156618 RepID=UPI0032B39671